MNAAGRKARVGFVLDHPKRDLPGAVRLAHALRQRGADVFIIPLYDQAVDVPLLGLDALIVNFARTANQELVRNYSASGIDVYVLDTEGGVLTENGANSPAALAQFVKSAGFNEHLAGYFFWGSTLHDAFQRSSGMPAERLHVTGCPRFDWASPRFSDLLEFEKRDFVLVNANFPLVNPLFASSPEAECDALVAAGWDRAYVEGIIEDLRLVFGRYLEAVGELARRLPGERFLVRPHPFEQAQPYRDAFDGLPNVEVDGRGSVLNVVRNSKCVVHLNCGTAIEATMLGRLPISLEYLNTARLADHTPLPSKVSHLATDLDSAVESIAAVEELARRFDFVGNYARHIQPWFHLNDGAAADRVADVVLRGRTIGVSAGDVWMSLRASRSRPRLLQIVQAVAANLLGSRAVSRARALFSRTRSVKEFDLVAIAGGLDRLAERDGLGPSMVRRAKHPLTGLPLSSIRVE